VVLSDTSIVRAVEAAIVIRKEGIEVDEIDHPGRAIHRHPPSGTCFMKSETHRMVSSILALPHGPHTGTRTLFVLPQSSVPATNEKSRDIEGSFFLQIGQCMVVSPRRKLAW
jgi:hypothetical protein